MCELLKISRVAFATVAAFFVLNNYTFIDPVLAIHLNAKFGTGANAVGLYFFVLGLGYMVACLSFGLLVKFIPRRVIMHSGAVLFAGGLVLVGPSKLLGLPENLLLVWAGLTVTGLGCGFLLVPLMQEKVEAARAIFRGREKRVSDLISGIHTAGMSAGEMVGPLIGSWLYDAMGFEWTCDSMSFALLGFTALHLAVCDAPAMCSVSYRKST